MHLALAFPGAALSEVRSLKLRRPVGPGEVRVRGPLLFDGYFEDDEATAEATLVRVDQEFDARRGQIVTVASPGPYTGKPRPALVVQAAPFDEMIAMGQESGAQYPFLVQITEVGDLDGRGASKGDAPPTPPRAAGVDPALPFVTTSSRLPWSGAP